MGQMILNMGQMIQNMGQMIQYMGQKILNMGWTILNMGQMIPNTRLQNWKDAAKSKRRRTENLQEYKEYSLVLDFPENFKSAMRKSSKPNEPIFSQYQTFVPC